MFCEHAHTQLFNVKIMRMKKMSFSIVKTDTDNNTTMQPQHVISLNMCILWYTSFMFIL